MYIQKVKLQNFRSFGDEGICFLFNKGINAVIGENNNGKTALIDAIRIAFSCVLYKKDIFFSKTDFHVNAAGERAAFAQIDVYLKDVPQNLIEIWDPIQPDCGEFHVVFTLEKTAAGTDKVKYRAWGGKCEGNLLSSDTLEAINLDYLSALRDIGDFRWNSNGKLTKNGKDIICTGTQQYAPPCIQFKKRLLEKGLFFQDEVSGLACILLERYPEIAKSIALRFPVIILDEAQDTSEEQMRILDLLCAAGLESMYIVGDPDQAIYEWRNANPESFLEKMHDSEWTQLVLSENFRSSQMICNATYIFSDTNKDKKANNASGPFATYNKKPVLFLYDKDTAEDLIIQRFKEECTACDISVSPDKVAIVTRSKIHSDDSIDNLWKTPETELLARASFEWMCDNRKKAYVFCERALFQMVVKDLKDIDVSIEWDVSQIIQYAKWKQVVIEILIRLPSADEECGQWVTNSRDIVHKILVSHNVAMRDGITMNDAIKIKTRDKKHPDFRKIPIRCYFEIKSKAEYTYSSIHGVKGETFDALMLLIHGTVGNTLTPSFLANGKTNTELMRIAYVAMTRPRKLLVVAMPKNKAKLSNRFPPDKWDYVEL